MGDLYIERQRLLRQEVNEVKAFPAGSFRSRAKRVKEDLQKKSLNLSNSWLFFIFE